MIPSDSETIFIYGASGHGGVIGSILIDTNPSRNLVFLDDDLNKLSFHGFSVLHNCNLNPSPALIVGIGKNSIRKEVTKKFFNAQFVRAIHPTAYVNDLQKIGEGTVVMQNATIQIGTTVGKHVIINTSAVVDHDCQIHDFAHVAPNATITGNVIIEEGAWVGAGAVVLPGITIGKWSIVGAGAVVTQNVEPFTTVVGNPARILKK